MKIGILLIGLFVSVAAYPLVLHPDGEPTPLWQDRPPDAVAARVGACSGTVIDPQYIITVSHCTVTMETSIKVAGQTYYPEAIYTHPSQDIRLIKVYGANFTDYVPVPDGPLPVEQNPIMVVSGWGKTRGNQIYATTDPNILVGYGWSGSYGQLKWGTTKIDGYTESGIFTKFEHLNDPRGTAYECAMATYDSGCGMYCKLDGQWYIAAIGRKVVDEGYDYFRDPDSPDQAYGTMNFYLRVHPFLGWIKSILYGPDINEDGQVNDEDLSELSAQWLCKDSIHYYRADLNRDGIVNFMDLSLVSDSWDSEVLTGDITRDGRVDGDDLGLLMEQWMGPPQDPSADIEPDGRVDFFDFSLLARNWQK